MKLKKVIDKMFIKPGSKVSLDKHPTDYKNKTISKEEASQMMEAGIVELQKMQDKLISHNQHSILVVIQAMDAAGKDSVVKHVLTGLAPGGVRVVPFKAPTDTELEHDYLWRHNLALPARGEIGIFVRSHYENVLVTRVHPEYILNENIPGINKLSKVNDKFFKTRFRQINDWEQHLSENGMTIIKIFLHSSKEEQKKQFMERIDDADKNWKFNIGDIKERAHWDDYMKAYEDLLSHTSTKHAPWFVVPADDRWFARISIGSIIYREFERLKLSYPVVSEEQKQQLAEARKLLLAED
jgi:PPK2 family polyphosphate:nucleotide phosphotransferase